MNINEFDHGSKSDNWWRKFCTCNLIALFIYSLILKFRQIKFEVISFIVISAVAGCGYSERNEFEHFKSRVTRLLENSDSIEVAASELTDSDWRTLCFKRGDQLELIFSNDDLVAKLELDYNNYYVSEAYVKGSLDGRCISGGDLILINRRYQENSELIEFSSINN